ncbi:hypothetical protein RI065_08085 [Mycoplasmatota bacterium zrk1]
MKYLKYFLFCFLFYLIIISPSEIKENVSSSLILWVNYILPILFPVFIVTDLIIQNDLTNKIGSFLSPLFSFLFNISKKSSVIIILSIFAGNPSSARILKNLIEKDEISIAEANYILSFTSFANPIFIYNVFGIAFFKNYTVGLILLISHYSSNFIIALFNRPKEKFTSNSDDIKSTNIVESISKNIQVVLNIAGFIVFINVIKLVLTEFIQNKTTIIYLIINGMFEFVSGIQYIAASNEDLKLLVGLASFTLGFAGIAIHLQVYSLIYEKLSYMKYLIARFVQGILSFFITLLIFNFFYIEAVTVTKNYYSLIYLFLVLLLIRKNSSE